MKVKDVMKTDVGFCSTEDSPVKAAEIMLRRDCGVVPIVDAENKIVGMLTDRDLCLAIIARKRKASTVKCKDLINGKAIVCAGDDNLEDVLRKMRKHRIKRLPVVEKSGELVGILSITDIMLSIRKDKSLKKKVQSTLKTIFKARPIVLREISAGNDESGEQTSANTPNF